MHSPNVLVVYNQVIVHDLESKCPLEVLQHQRAVCSLSIDPFNERVVATAGNDGRLLLFDTRHSVHGKTRSMEYSLLLSARICEFVLGF